MIVLPTLVADLKINGCRHSNFITGLGKNGCHQMTGGGFAVGAGYANNFHASGRELVDQSRGDSI